MALSKQQKIGIGLGVGILGVMWAVSRSSKTPTHQKEFYRPGESFRVLQGIPFIVRVPRGDYQVLNTELSIVDQIDMGNSTDVYLLAEVTPTQYTVAGILSNVDHPDRLYRFTVNARKTA